MFPALLTLALLAPAKTPHPRKVLEQRGFDVNGAACVLSLTDQTDRTKETDEKVIVRCNGALVFAKDIGFGDVQNIQIYDEPTRLIIPFERGLTTSMIIVSITSNQFGTKAETVFDSGSRTGTEVFEEGALLFAHVGARFHQAGFTLPSGTNVYRWIDDKYVFEGSYRWKSGATWMDRYCILLNPDTCPAERTQKPLPNIP